MTNDSQNTYRRDPAPGAFDINALSNAEAEKLASTTTLSFKDTEDTKNVPLMSLKLDAELPWLLSCSLSPASGA